jgi:tRNA(fMet)-specific endonuclease VapC
LKYLLDSNIIIFITHGQNGMLRQRLADVDEGDVVISSVAFAEVAQGSFNGKPPAPDVLDRFVAAVTMLPFDDAAARVYATIPFKRARFDRLIAAHALSLGLTVVTDNEADFADVPGLRVENWTV